MHDHIMELVLLIDQFGSSPRAGIDLAWKILTAAPPLRAPVRVVYMVVEPDEGMIDRVVGGYDAFWY